MCACKCNHDTKVVKIEMIEGFENYFPIKAHPEDAAYDLFACEDVTIGSGERKAISVGFRMELPTGYCAKILPRSGNALKRGLTIINTPGLIDENYRGIVKAIVINLDPNEQTIACGEKIAQMMIEQVVDTSLVASTIDMNTDRGESGFGSTGLAGGRKES